MNERPPLRTDRPPRPGDFLKTLYRPQPRVPDPSQDFGTYNRMDAAFNGLREHLDGLRSNQGRVGYGSQNSMSDLSKDFIETVARGEEETAAYAEQAMDELIAGLKEAMDDGQLAESGNRFSRTVHQERWEAILFGKLWPVIVGKAELVPELISWKDFKGNVQAYLYGFLDVVSELSKSLADEFFFNGLTPDQEFDTMGRYLAIADSITLQLSQERHIPGYVINNGPDRWTAFSKKLRVAYGTIAHVRRDYNSSRRTQRMNQDLLASIQQLIQNAVQK